MLSRQNTISIVALLFVISGAVGLVYQIVWFKFLSLFLGNTTYAQTIVLATFMGGLAIGSAWGGRRADREVHLLRTYAYLELGVGLYCVLYPSILGWVGWGFVHAAHGMGLTSGQGMTLALKLLVSLCTLLFPTVLMGATLPVLVRFASSHVRESGRNIAVLYFLSSFGAVIGAILAGFFFVRILGLHLTIYCGSAVSMIIGGTALALSRMRLAPGSEEGSTGEEPGEEVNAAGQYAAIAAAGLSGAAAMVFEVTWVRMLIPVLGSSTYSFSIMLTGVIAGITAGSLLAAALLRVRRNVLRLLAVCQFAVVAAMLLTMPLYGRIPYVFWNVARILVRTDVTYPIFLIIEFGFSFFIVAVPTVFLGMSLPLAARLATRTLNSLGRSVGNVFAVNTIGTVIGSLGAGLVLVPLVGVRHAMEAGVFLNLLAGLVVLAADGRWTRRLRWLTAVAAVAGMIMYALLVPDWGRGAMLSGVFRLVSTNAAPPESYARFREASEHETVLYYRDGTTGTVGVIQRATPEGPQRILIINGKADASSRADLPTQVLLGELPMLVHRQPSTALVIGLGSGVTLGSLLRHPLERVDCVEISPEVVEASALFDSVSQAPLRDPRAVLTIEDALAFLKLTPRRFDVIVSEPSNPWIAGIGDLYTTEFFEACKSHMNRGGLMVQWFHLYEMDDELFKLVVRTFQQSFPSVSVWQSMSSDVILLGSAEPMTNDDEHIRSVMERPKVREDLARTGIVSLPALLSLRIMADEAVARFAGAGPTNTEDLPRLEYEAPKAFFVNRGVGAILQSDERLKLGRMAGLLGHWKAEGLLHDEDLRTIGMLHTQRSRGNLHLGCSVLEDYLRRAPNDVEVLQRMAEAAAFLHRSEQEIEFLRRLVLLEPENLPLREQYAWAWYTFERSRANGLTGFDAEPYVRMIRTCIAACGDTVTRYRARLADMYYNSQEYQKAADQYARALQIRESHQADASFPDDALLLQLARCLHELGQTDRALGYALQASQTEPANRDASDFIYQIWMQRGMTKPDTSGR